MSEHFQVRMHKAVHVFSAGHFITLRNDLCEAVHGHNWTVAAKVVGEPDAHGMVIDFILLRDLLSKITARLDHRMLLPTQNRFLTVTTQLMLMPTGECKHPSTHPDSSPAAEIEVRFADRRWVFPADECVLLPIENTTAEWLARWIGRELFIAMTDAGSPLRGTLGIEVDECLGQAAVWEHHPDARE
ncbi:MAG: 6-carboxytetrahydropterin synthase [Planctomycetia bacterium]|nr:6-carboxytetrahydropterin synthase [Planctomycetia bacterium]RLT12706.1 MAG: 6-pyruvoyl tetrahydrobiopterin synthase [Planctomycetota bacterium]